MAVPIDITTRGVSVSPRKPWIWSLNSAKYPSPPPPPVSASQSVPAEFPDTRTDRRSYTYSQVGVVPVPIRPWPRPYLVFQTTPNPFPAEGWSYSIVGVVPVPIQPWPRPLVAFQNLWVYPQPFPAEGWAFGKVGVVPVPIVKPPPLAAPPIYLTPNPFPAEGWDFCYVGVVPVPIVKPPPLLQSYQYVPLPFPAEGISISVVGVVPVPIVKTPPLCVAITQTTPQPFPEWWASYSRVGVVSVPIVKTPPLVLAKESLPVPFPAEGTARISYNIFAPPVVVTFGYYPPAVVPYQQLPVPFPDSGTTQGKTGVVPVPIVKTPPLLQAFQFTPSPFPADGISISIVGVVSVPIVKTPLPVTIPQLTPIPFPDNGYSISAVGVVPVPIVKTPPSVYAKESLPIPFPFSGSAASTWNIFAPIVVIPPYTPAVVTPWVTPQPFPAEGWKYIVPPPYVTVGTVMFTNFLTQDTGEWGNLQGSPLPTIAPLSDRIMTARCNPVTTQNSSLKIGGLGLAGSIFGPPNTSLRISFFRFYFKWEIKPSSNYEWFFFCADVNSAGILHLALNSSGKIEVYDGVGDLGVLVGTSATVLSQSTWYRIEAQAHAGTPAAWEVKVSNELLSTPLLETFNGTGVNAAGNIFQCTLGKPIDRNGNTVDFYFRHFFWSTAGYPGPGQCIALLPNANGFYVNGVANGAGQLWQCIDEIPPDDDVTYINGLTQGQAYTAKTGGSVAGKINSLKSYARGKRDGASGTTWNTRLRSGGTDVDTEQTGVGFPVYSPQQKIFDVEPATGLPWVSNTVNAAEVGFIQNISSPARITAAYIMIDYVPFPGPPAPVSAIQSIPYPFPEPGSALCVDYYPFFVIVVTPASSSIKDIWTSGQSITGGVGGSATQGVYVPPQPWTIVAQQQQTVNPQASLVGKVGGKATQ